MSNIPLSKDQARELQRKIDQRLFDLRKITDFAKMITARRGRKIKHEVQNSHTHRIDELHDFGGFSFYAETWETMMGGNTVRVWYHPGKKFDDITAHPDLDVRWQTTIENCRTEVFNEKSEWLKTIKTVMVDWKKIEHKIDSAATTAEKEAKKAREELDHVQRLLQTANRLGMR